MNEPAARIKHVDGLRALAVVSVLLYHSTSSLPNASWFFEGRHGVDLFFVISGFCLSYPILNSIAKAGIAVFDVPSFFVKRVVRIVPPYYAAIIAFVTLTALLLVLRIPLPATMRAISPLDILKQFLFFDYNANFSNSSFWTLAVEARWYVLFPFILWLWINKRKAFWLVAALSFSLYHFTRIGGTDFFSAGIDFATLPAFMFGILAADLHVRADSRARYAVWFLPLLLLPTILVRHSGHFVQDTIDWQLISLCLLVTIGHYNILARIFSWRPWAFIGICSYSIYLYHEPVIGLLEGLHLAWPAAALASLVTGVFAWYLIERRLQSPATRNAWLAELRTTCLTLFRRFDLPEQTILKGVALTARAPATPQALIHDAIRPVPSHIGNFGIGRAIPEPEP